MFQTISENISAYLADKLSYTSLYEMAQERSEAKRFIQGRGKQIYVHLIKILKYDDKVNFKKHIHDIDNWFYDATLKPRGRVLPEKDLYEWLYDGRFGGSLGTLQINIRRIHDDYQTLPKFEITDEELYDKIEGIFKKASKDIHLRTFNTVEDYL